MNPIYKITVSTLVVSVAAALVVLGQAPQSSDVRELPPNQAIEREITGAEIHRYKFDMQANEFFQVRVEQKGVEVALKLREARGNVLATMESIDGENGPETLTFVAPLKGNYLLEVSGFYPKAEKGPYTIRREAARTATAKDRRRVEVEQLFVAGMAARDAHGQTEIAIRKLGEALAGWQELNDEYLAEVTAETVKQLKGFVVDTVFAEARGLANDGTAASARTSLLRFADARKLYQGIGDRRKEASCLVWLGHVHSSLAEKQQALEFFDLALVLRRALGDRGGEAIVLNNIGLVYDDLGERRKALEFHNLALQLRRDIGDRGGEATTLNNIGGVYSALGENQKALEFISLALAVKQAVGDRSGEATTLNNIGLVYDDLGENQKALEFYNLALPLLRAIGNRRGEADILNNIGSVYRKLGQKHEALKFFNLSLPLCRSVGDRGCEAGALNSIGVVYQFLGEGQKALESYNLALPLFRTVGDRRGEATSFNNIGSVYRDLGEKLKALEFLNLALPLLRAVGDRSGEATTLNNIGRTYHDLGEKQKAREFYDLALPLLRAVGKRSGEATTLNNIGLLHDDLGEKQKALESFNLALPLCRAAGDWDTEALTLDWLRGIWLALKNPGLAVFYGKQSVNKYQELRLAIQGLDKETQKTYLKTVEPAYRKLADILISEGRFAQAEQVLAMLKEEEYFDFVRRDADEIKNLNQRVPLNEKEQKLIARYSLLADRISQTGQDFLKLDEKKRKLVEGVTLPADEQKRYDELAGQLTDANAAFKLFLEKELVAELGTQTTREIEIDRSLQDKLRNWGAGTVALRTVVTEDRYRVILTTPAVQIDGKTEITAAELNKKVFAFRQALQRPNVDPRPLGKELYDILIKPIEKDLQQAGATTLVWSLDGTLRYIPLAALSPDGLSYLVEKYQNVIITPKTATDLAAANTGWRALGVGVSDAQSIANPDQPQQRMDFSSLPGTRAELLAIVRDEKAPGETGVLAGRRYLDRDFTLRNFTDSLTRVNANGGRQYNLVHIASHFHLGSNWSNSFLVLGNGEVLTLEQLSNSPEIRFGDVELITLWACNTAFADESNGKEIDSLAEAIQAKSGKSVLATLWPVADESTQLLMREFYRLHEANSQWTKAEALRQAQRALMKGNSKDGGPATTTQQRSSERLDSGAPPAPSFKIDPNAKYSHPYYWAPFILIGNWK